MKLLIVTQAVDTEDPLLGFFHSWIDEFARRAVGIHVICLKEGVHRLPANVSVHSLGKETGRSRIKYIRRFFAYAWRYRSDYDAVFVHMNQEYVLLYGLVWRLLGKRVVLWRNHVRGSLATRVAGMIAHRVCFTSPEAYVAHFTNARMMPLGIDTRTFKPSPPMQTEALLILGRIDPIKRVDECIEAVKLLDTARALHVDVYGSPSEGNEAYAKRVHALSHSLVEKGIVAFHGPVAHAETPALYASHSIYINITPSGSFDKTIGEALACGCLVVTANNAVREIIPTTLFIEEFTRSAIAQTIEAARTIEPAERKKITESGRSYIEERHSLTRLMLELLSDLRA